MVTISDETLRLASLTEQELLKEIAIVLYQRGVPLGKASEVANMDRFDFRDLLSERRVPVHYTVANLEEDVRTHDMLRERAGESAI